MIRNWRRGAGVLAAVLTAGILVSSHTTADAAEQASGPTTPSVPSATAPAQPSATVLEYWNRPSSASASRLDQSVVVESSSPRTFWSLYWWWTDAPAGNGGYIGVQRDGNRFDGTVGPMAIFSLWDARAAKGTSCGQFSGEGVGWSCRAPIVLKQGTRYTLVVTKGVSDNTGQWWDAWVTGGSQITVYLGSIAVDPVHSSFGDVVNFTEPFGPARTCTELMPSSVHWGQPEANRGMAGHFSYTVGTAVLGGCPTGAVGPSPTPYDGMLNMKLGGDSIGLTQLDDNAVGHTPAQDTLIDVAACKTLNSTGFGPVWHIKVLIATTDPTVMGVRMTTYRRVGPGSTTQTLGTVQSTSWLNGLTVLETDVYALPTFTAPVGDQYWDFVDLAWFNKNNAGDASRAGQIRAGDGLISPARPEDGFNEWAPLVPCR